MSSSALRSDRDSSAGDSQPSAPMSSTSDAHSLEHCWTLWYYTPSRSAAAASSSSWDSSLTPVGTFDTVERFWSYYRNALWPSSIDFKSNYHLFKHDIKPMWEDPANQHGGKWILYIKHDRINLDQYWENLVLGLVGETIDSDGNEICGAVISRRRAADRISVWNRTSTDKDKIMSLGRSIKKAVIDEVEHPPKFSMEWTVHESETMTNSKPVRWSAKHAYSATMRI